MEIITFEPMNYQPKFKKKYNNPLKMKMKYKYSFFFSEANDTNEHIHKNNTF